MCRNLTFFVVSLFLVLPLADSASALIVIDTDVQWGQTSLTDDVQVVDGGTLTVTGTFSIVNGHTLTVEEGGEVIVNPRVNFDTGGTLVMNGGNVNFNDTVKFPDNDDGAVYIYLYGGILICGDTESYASRGSELHVGAGIMRTGGISLPRRDPDSADWNIQPIPPYDTIIITDLGGDVKEISTATIVPEIQFSSEASGALETVSPATLTVTLVNPEEGETYTVEYAATGGTATADVDYTLTPGTLTFEPGETTETISIAIINDGNDEEDETIIVALSNPTGPDVTLGAITEHTYTIIDPRPDVQFNAQTSGEFEDAGSAAIPISLSHTTPDTVTVEYAVTGGTATGGGVDYTLEAGTLTFDPCETNKTIDVIIVDDAVEDSMETIELTLSNPVNAKLGDTAQHTFKIYEKGHALLRGAFYFRADSDASAKIGPHPDITVRHGDGDDKLIFRRDKGYLPVWYTEGSGEEDFPVEVSRSGCETTVNTYSRVEVIETSPARAVVHWRYARNCDGPGLTDWVDEHFTVYPDGVCMRTVKDAAGTTFAQWNTATPDIYGLQLLPGGIGALPASWLDPPALSITSGNYSDEGFNDERRCYTLQCNVTCDPSALDFTLDTTGGKSIHNPAIVLKNWGDADAQVTVNGGSPGLYYTGYADNMYGDHLVVWLGIESAASVDVTITPQGGSGQFVNRAPPPEHSHNFDDSPPLPLGSSQPGPFGAYYTNLKFNNRFDESYRMGKHADVVVQFDDNAHRFVFWRGTNYQPHWAGDTSETPQNPHWPDVGIEGLPYSCWYGTQFLERRGSEWDLPRYLEPMSDWECRYSHVRIISSNPARAIVHWRYAPCHLDYRRNNTGSDPWGDWADEYYTIYPDAISVRMLVGWSRGTGGPDDENPHFEYHEAMPVTNPGTVPEDNIHWHALSATDYAGNKEDWEAQDVDGGAMTDLDQITNKPIMVVRMKGSTVPVSIVEGTSVEHDPVGQHDCRPFNAYDDWPAWPDNDRSFKNPPPGLWDEDPDTHCYRFFWQKYCSHCSILHLKWQSYEHIQDKKKVKIMLFGMFDAATLDQYQGGSVTNLIPLARSWQFAPSLSINSSGFSGGSYDKTQRAYRISRTSVEATTLQFTLQGSASSPIVNPCFVVENWPGDRKASLTIDGQTVNPDPNVRQGIEKNVDEVSSLVVWIKKESTSPIDITISPGILADFTGPNGLPDCTVNLYDLEVMSNHWLEDNFSPLPVGQLVAWWEFDEGSGTTANDSAGDSNGTLNGDPNWVTGHTGTHALDFDGDGDYVRTGYEDGPSEYTIALWYNLNEDINTSTFSGWRALASKTADETPTVDCWSIWWCTTYGVGLSNEVSGGNYASVAYKPAMFYKNEWHHVAVTGSATQGKIYFDGDLKNTSNDDFVTGAWDDSVPFDIARPYYGTAGRFFNGKTDDVRIYDYELNAEEVMRIYEGLPLEDRLVCSGYPVGDLNYDCEVTFDDFADFGLHWLETCP